MNKKLVRLTESDLHRIIKESVNRILMESEFDELFDGEPHTYTVTVMTKSDGKFGYAFENIRTPEELDSAVKAKFPDLLNWSNPRKNKPFRI